MLGAENRFITVEQMGLVVTDEWFSLSRPPVMPVWVQGARLILTDASPLEVKRWLAPSSPWFESSAPQHE